MGLMYVFPISIEEEGFAVKNGDSLTLKSYGLPYIFWIYAACSITLIFFMFLAIKEPVLKLVSLGDETDATLGYTLLTFIGLLPVCILAFFFYEKRIIKKSQQLTLQYRIFGLRVFSENFNIPAQDPFSVESFLNSPNVARMEARKDSQGFQNKGYYVLWLNVGDKKRILIDRHSRKADLVKLKELLTADR